MQNPHEPFCTQPAPKSGSVAVQPVRLIRLPEVMHQTGLARSSIYDGIAAGSFPKPVPLCGRNVGWVEAEVQRWVTERIAASRGAA
ncbi:AlpA family transcriptional regulator [Rhodanobacter sp. C05]|uniref:helix-turn-helix transcriptional regulator n=1 Tax=Rhodanobacter sp. C05 TaxID=1945855 RepID=UPI000984855A|nr:AlpA family transcriptional regulator [Rhodanobacter sp. C05]OOG42014.1 hypothetical protein B0E51_05515 [Rhodanobacter sp. C05]